MPQVHRACTTEIFAVAA